MQPRVHMIQSAAKSKGSFGLEAAVVLRRINGS